MESERLPYEEVGCNVAQCKRHAPVMNEGLHRWPLVENFDGCGDFEKHVDPEPSGG